MPMRPDGVVTDTAVATFGVDEWATEHCWTANPRPPNMTRTETHISKIRKGQTFTLSATARTTYTARNTPKHADARGNYSVRISTRESLTITAAEPTVWLVG